MLGRTELSVLINDPAIVEESCGWFEGLWATASPPIIAEGDMLVEALDSVEWTSPRSRVKLTSSTAKIAAVLSDRVPVAGFDVVSSMAKAGIAESNRLLSLEEAYREISDLWFQSGKSFTFAELLQAVSMSTSKVAAADLWSFIIHETANHWLGGLTRGYDRYCYHEGQFFKWQPEHLYAIQPLESCLSFVLSAIPVSPERSYLPTEEKWKSAGVAEHQILPLLDEFISIGLIIEHDEAGDIEHYSLDPEFEWPRRWSKFSQSHALYNKRLKNRMSVAEDVPDDGDNEWAEEEKFDSFEQEYISKIERELDSTAKRLGITSQNLLNIGDFALAELFGNLRQNLGHLTMRQLSSLIANLPAQHLPADVLKAMNSQTGAFRRNVQTGRARPSSSWEASVHLATYPRALRAWKRLF